MAHHGPQPTPVSAPAPTPAQADGTGARRRQQSELYGASVAELAAEMSSLLGLDGPAVASTIGVSAPMFERVRDGSRVRLGNPGATARLLMLRDLCGHLRAGRAAATDVPLALRQIQASDPIVSAPSAQVSGLPPGLPVGLPVGRAVDSANRVLTEQALREATRVVRREILPTPTRRWPLLEEATGVETWVKHENHCPTGAFKVRGGLVYVDRLLAQHEPGQVAGLITATGGNHGQSVAYAGTARGLPVTIVVPEHNSGDKNRAMAAYGARLVMHGQDFQAACEHAAYLAQSEGLRFVPSFDASLVAGVATYAAELHASVPDLDVIYVPIGMGSGACANVAVRDLLGLRTEIVGVVAEGAPAYALSVAAGEPVSTETANTLVDPVACRVPDQAAVRILAAGLARVVRVSDVQAQQAMALMYAATHNLAEPAGSLSLAGLLADTDRPASASRLAVVHTGGNCDLDVLTAALDAGPAAG